MVVARLERALGEESAKLMHRNLEFWRTTKNEAAIEEWRQQQVARMFSLRSYGPGDKAETLALWRADGAL